MSEQCKEVTFKACEEDSITIRQYEGRKDFSIQVDSYDGWTYLSRDEMLNLIDGLKEFVGDGNV